jgi:polyisoprenoid-binding protein YceI
MDTRLTLTVLFLLGATAARADEYVVEADQVLVTYVAKKGPHQISGVSHSLEWSLVALESGDAHVQFRVPVASFDSGHSEIDSLLRKAVDTGRNPFVEVEGTVRDNVFEGTLTLHGRSRPLQAKLGIARSSDQLVAHVSFAIALDEFDVALAGVDFIARLRAHPQAVITFGSVRASN